MRGILLLLLLACGTPPRLFAQRYSGLEVPRYELGLQFNFAHTERVNDALQAGVRFHYNFTEHLALDSEFDYGTNSVPGANIGGQSTFLIGLRTGQRVRDSGFFVHARGGFLGYGAANGAPPPFTRNTVPAFDAGGTLEQYFGSFPRPWERNTFFRLEIGALLVPYGNAMITPPPSPVLGSPPPLSGRLGTRIGPVVSLGVGVRF